MTRLHAVIVGGGLSGIGMAATLHRLGIDDYLLVERGDGLGGTWHHNTYPGRGCDIPSALNSFGFRPNPGWTRMFASREEIRDYLCDVAEEYDVPRHARLGTEMLSAGWDAEGRVWRISTSAGELVARWPGSMLGMWRRMRRFDLAPYEPVPASVPAVERETA